MKYLVTLSILTLILFSSCSQDTFNETLPDNVFEEEVTFVEITSHTYLTQQNKGRIEFTVDLDVFSEEQRERITRLYFQYDETIRFIDNLEQRTYAFPISRGEICIRFGFASTTILSNPGAETCIVF